MQKFKANDELEQKVIDSALPILSLIGSELDNFYDGAYSAFPLGDVLWELKRSPLSGDLSQDDFRRSFFAIHTLFTRPGTFEFYLEVFRAIFGDDVEVEFTVPGPGKLLINIVALTISLDLALIRSIEDNQYFYEELIDHEGDNIVFQSAVGIQTQRELDALIFELSPSGVWVTGTLTFE